MHDKRNNKKYKRGDLLGKVNQLLVSAVDFSATCVN